MRPFKSVSQALGFYFRQATQLESPRTTDLRPRVQGLDSRSRNEDKLAVYLSISLCLDALGAGETLAVREKFGAAGGVIGDDHGPVYHRAMTKLGREMRRRGVVG